MSSKKTNKKAPTNGFDRPFHLPPKIAIGSNLPLTEDFQKSPIPLNPVGIPTMSNVGQFSKFCLCQQLYAFKEFRMETRLLIISKTTNAKKFIKTILKSSY